MKIIRYTDVVSTNSIALELGEKGAAHGTTVVTDKQSDGRGRMERSFASPAGGLYFSIILRPEIEPEHISFLTLAAGVACCTTLEKASELSVMLKWPNDIYIGTKKLGGILTEAAAYSNVEQRIPFLVVGIGLNINTPAEKFPHSLRESITSLYYIQNRCYDLETLMADIVQQLDKYACNLSSLRDEICETWQKHDYLNGKEMTWIGPQGKDIRGTGAGILRDGRYQLQTKDDTMHPVLGGELNLVENEDK